MYLFDSNAVIYFLDASLPASALQKLKDIADEQCIVSVITKMETLGFNFKSVQEQNSMETFIGNASVLDLNNNIVSKTIAIRKAKKISLPDAIISATAIEHNLTLLSRNTHDFESIEGLKIVNPFEM